jgi:hypothetical protein
LSMQSSTVTRAISCELLGWHGNLCEVPFVGKSFQIWRLGILWERSVQEESEEPAGTSLSFIGRTRFKNCERKSAVRRRAVAFCSTFQVAADGCRRDPRRRLGYLLT